MLVSYKKNSRQQQNTYALDGYILGGKTIEQEYEKCGIGWLTTANWGGAMCVYDATEKKVFAATDRLGSKGLYYHADDRGIEISTSLYAICRGKNYEIDPEARQCYFTLQYIPAPLSIVKEVRKLAAGEYLVYSLDSGKVEIKPYWDLYTNSKGFEKPQSYQECFDTMEKLIKDSIQTQLAWCGKKSYGSCLSGGIDSSLVTMLLKEQTEQLDSYTIRFDEQDFNEFEYASQVAKTLGVNLHDFLITTNDAHTLIEQMPNIYEEPMGDASAIPTTFLCHIAGKEKENLFCGDGGDEMFFGYPRYLRYASKAWIYQWPYAIRNIGAAIANMAEKKRIADSLRMKDIQSLYINRRPSNHAEQFSAFEVQHSIDQHKYLYGNNDIRKSFNDYDIKTLMCYAFNVKLDRAAVAGGVNALAPLLDYRIAGYTRLIPVEFLYSKEMGQKRILRQLLYTKLPKQLFERKKKGFAVPVGRWLQHDLKDILLDTVNSHTIALLPDFDGQELLNIRDRHIAGKEDQRLLLWLCVNYILWYRKFETINIQ